MGHDDPEPHCITNARAAVTHSQFCFVLLDRGLHRVLPQQNGLAKAEEAGECTGDWYIGSKRMYR